MKGIWNKKDCTDNSKLQEVSENYSEGRKETAKKGKAALDANALIRGLEKGKLTLLDTAIKSKTPAISIL